MGIQAERTRLVKQLKSNNFDFDSLCLDVFQYQRKYNPVYKEYLEHLGTTEQLQDYRQIPFLPIQFFKSHQIRSGYSWQPEAIFESSGTTGQMSSKHHLRSLDLYLENAARIFESQVGRLNDFIILALLPSYLEKGNSSLVAMCKDFMDRSGDALNGFFLHDYEALQERLLEANRLKKKCLLLGVTYALLDFPVGDKTLFENTLIVETGGMKGRKKEITRKALHQLLKDKFGVASIYSEYGMTELLSQAWSLGEGIFELPATMKLLFREITDPFSYVPEKKSGVINVIDLANIDSCAFIATEDLGRPLNERQFEVLGRTDESDIRGCNLMFGQLD